MENIDQRWVKENIDIIMKEFLFINPKFRKKDDVSRMARSRHKKKMLENMDSPQYRAYYYIAKKYPESKDALNKKVKRFYNEAKENEQSLKVWKSKYENLKRRVDQQQDLK
tara:strand:+ start:1531 stop:1863 length:333 start_codon:yes stop_codon:yes gene_type:complete